MAQNSKQFPSLFHYTFESSVYNKETMLIINFRRTTDVAKEARKKRIERELKPPHMQA